MESGAVLPCLYVYLPPLLWNRWSATGGAMTPRHSYLSGVGPFLDLNIVFNVVAPMAVPDAPTKLLAGLGSWGLRFAAVGKDSAGPNGKWKGQWVGQHAKQDL